MGSIASQHMSEDVGSNFVAEIHEEIKVDAENEIMEVEKSNDFQMIENSLVQPNPTENSRGPAKSVRPDQSN